MAKGGKVRDRGLLPRVRLGPAAWKSSEQGEVQPSHCAGFMETERGRVPKDTCFGADTSV